MEGLIEFWKLAKKHPITATVLILVFALGEVSWEILHKRAVEYLDPPPFAHLQGLYSGTAERTEFNLCLVVDGDRVHGTMTWPKRDPDNHYYVDYTGTIASNEVNLSYTRNPGNPNEDRGIAVISLKDGRYGGFWESSEHTNRQEWSLTKIANACQPLGWEGATNNSS